MMGACSSSLPSHPSPFRHAKAGTSDPARAPKVHRQEARVVDEILPSSDDRALLEPRTPGPARVTRFRGLQPKSARNLSMARIPVTRGLFRHGLQTPNGLGGLGLGSMALEFRWFLDADDLHPGFTARRK